MVVVHGNKNPAHVRLILKKPRCFSYSPGQRCYLQLRRPTHLGCGSSNTVSVMEWHPFSLASAPKANDDILEFHITVMGKAVELQDGSAVTVSAVPGELLLRRSRNPLDWICPYRVPHIE